MQLSPRQLVALALLAGVGGCSSGDDDADPIAPLIPCEVQEVLKAKCLRCHGQPTQNGAPYQFLTLEQIWTKRGGKPLYERMLAVLASGSELPMPPLTFDVEPTVAPLDDDEREILVEWAMDAAPAGDACN